MMNRIHCTAAGFVFLIAATPLFAQEGSSPPPEAELQAAVPATDAADAPTVDQLFDAALLRYENLQQHSEAALRHWDRESRQARELLEQRLKAPELAARIEQATATDDEDRPEGSAAPESRQTDRQSEPAPTDDEPISPPKVNAPDRALPGDPTDAGDQSDRVAQRSFRPATTIADSVHELRSIRGELRSIAARLDQILEPAPTAAPTQQP